jgi:inosine/xanthosine triphosphatase
MQIVVGSENPAKLRAAESACKKIFPSAQIQIIGCTVDSGVSAQPISAKECMKGALNRAKSALMLHPDAEFGIGMEGGLEQVEDQWFECGWMAVVDRKSGKFAFGSTARVLVGPYIVHELTVERRELSSVIDELSQKTDVRSNLGFMGIVTNGALPRDECYAQGIMFAFAPFVSHSKFWE